MKKLAAKAALNDLLTGFRQKLDNNSQVPDFRGAFDSIGLPFPFLKIAGLDPFFQFSKPPHFTGKPVHKV